MSKENKVYRVQGKRVFHHSYIIQAPIYLKA